VAIDFLPSAEELGVPYGERYMPPDRFVRAFEKRGFIWGGKWFYWDTMHFEYRPEILALNGRLLLYNDSASPNSNYILPIFRCLVFFTLNSSSIIAFYYVLLFGTILRPTNN
jgi:hypothetical protein